MCSCNLFADEIVAGISAEAKANNNKPLQLRGASAIAIRSGTFRSSHFLSCRWALLWRLASPGLRCDVRGVGGERNEKRRIRRVRQAYSRGRTSQLQRLGQVACGSEQGTMTTCNRDAEYGRCSCVSYACPCLHRYFSSSGLSFFRRQYRGSVSLHAKSSK